MSFTTNSHDGCLHEIGPDGMQKCYLILPSGERKDLVRPLRRSYRHEVCGTITTMALPIAETYAANPSYYAATMCVECKGHYSVGRAGQFVWLDDGTKVGT